MFHDFAPRKIATPKVHAVSGIAAFWVQMHVKTFASSSDDW
jgi:hypothetical protein